jgi:glycolate oxidase iron-sulfur subunit
MNPADIVDYAKSLDCVHCGLCLRTCPTYQVSGRESSSPRGRIHLMRAIAEGDASVDIHLLDELDYCLVCRNCESACPSGVEYSHLLAHTKDALSDHGARSWFQRTALRLGLRHVLTSRLLISLNASLLRILQRTGVFRLLGRHLGPVGRSMKTFPEVPAAEERRELQPLYKARGKRRGTVAILEGCVMPALLGRVNRATVRVLQEAGRDVHVPRSPTCCGALQAHNGDLDTARDLARQTIAAHESLQDEGRTLAPIVVNSAGCSAQMKEYGQLLADDPEWKQRAEAFSSRVRDFSEYLAEEALAELSPQLNAAEVDLPMPLTFDDPCHLCHGQGVRTQPRILLDQLNVERVEIDESESCCGSAGLYSALRPDDSREILGPRLAALEKSGARTLVTANPGCHLQWQTGVNTAELEVQVLHIAEVLDRALQKTDEA